MANLPPPPDYAGKPSASSLLTNLYNLMRATARYIFGIGDYLDVTLWYNEVKGWFENLLAYLIYMANWYANEFYQVAKYNIIATMTFVNNLAGVVNRLLADFNAFVQPILDWWDRWAARLDVMVQTMYYFLKGLYDHLPKSVAAALGSAWTWVSRFFAAPLTTIEGYLAKPWSWVKTFYAAPLTYIESKLAGAWTWLKGLYADPYRGITLILGAVWLWAKSFYNAPLETLDAITGYAVNWMMDLFDIKPDLQKLFAANAMTYWYNLWSTQGEALSRFLHNPVTFILDLLYDTFLGWFEQLLADNW